jgi:hypothetical protein
VDKVSAPTSFECIPVNRVFHFRHCSEGSAQCQRRSRDTIQHDEGPNNSAGNAEVKDATSLQVGSKRNGRIDLGNYVITQTNLTGHAAVSPYDNPKMPG